MFESRDDVRFFLASLARSVRRGEIEVHAWCVLTTHFHLLVRSLAGELSRSMQRVQLAHVRRFNRGRRRDGPLVRGRFWSKPVESLTYRLNLLRYIDHNSVAAGLADRPEEYPWGSARSYRYREGPQWLERGWVEALVCDRSDVERYEGRLYPSALSCGDTEAGRALVERRSELPSSALGADDLDDLIAAAPAQVVDWLRRKAELADGTRPGLPVAAPETVCSSVSHLRDQLGGWPLGPTRRLCGWQILQAGLLRDMSGATQPEIAKRSNKPTIAVRRLCERHRSLLQTSSEYASRCGRVAHRSLAAIAAGG